MNDVTAGHGGSDFVEGRQRRHLVGDRLPVIGAGVCPVTSDGDRRRWLVSGYVQTREFLRDRRFSRAVLADEVHPRGPATRMSITEMDPPHHTRIRNLVGGAFSARRVGLLTGYVEREAATLLDRLIDEAPDADLLADFCAPLTFTAQSELLGVPPARRTVIRERATARLGRPGASRAAIYRGELLLHEEVVAMLADVDDPPFGLLGELVALWRDQGLITRQELTGLASSLFFDGHALAAAQIANTVLCVLGRPGLLPRIADDRELAGRVADEALRYTPSVTMSMTRVATEDVELDGVHIRPDDLVTAALPLVNRDVDAFADPDAFDPERTKVRHLSFGHGTHHCIGSHLARVEIKAAMQALARRAPRLGLTVAERDLTWTVSPTMRKLTALPVCWDVLARHGLAEAA